LNKSPKRPYGSTEPRFSFFRSLQALRGSSVFDTGAVRSPDQAKLLETQHLHLRATKIFLHIFRTIHAPQREHSPFKHCNSPPIFLSPSSLLSGRFSLSFVYASTHTSVEDSASSHFTLIRQNLACPQLLFPVPLRFSVRVPSFSLSSDTPCFPLRNRRCGGVSLVRSPVHGVQSRTDMNLSFFRNQSKDALYCERS